MDNKNITKNYRHYKSINYVLSKKYVIFINFLNKDTLGLFKKLISMKYVANIIYLNNIIKKQYYLKFKVYLRKHANVWKGGVHAILCQDLSMVHFILNLFALTPLYKDKYASLFTNKKINSSMNLGFITSIKIQSYFFKFNSHFLKFFFSLQNEVNTSFHMILSRQIVLTTIWLLKSLIMVSFFFLISLLKCFFILTKQMFCFIEYANKKPITS